ncbi:hypothetical protein [Leptothoe sp. PORK10 BA2]|uniref:hypothetical protein n=1 Tax=Leptothoe sp. PORK10 BA2 TaxID=3110254 RepID=UPI002B213636|nr:hypothetical protein [Leptothoe sp. PORK10 BA2]MEA5467206.1 hypothetical protein [Leptothoe sp. PORK10 BA2]
MQTQELLDYLDIEFSFRDQPVPLQPQLRVIWGLSILVLILHICCRGGRSSVARLHLLNWSLRNNENRERLTELLENRLSPFATLIRCEPGFNRAIEYAIAESLVEVVDGSQNLRIRLLEKGRQLANEIIEEDCLQAEKAFLREKCVPVTEKLAKSLLKQIRT